MYGRRPEAQDWVWKSSAPAVAAQWVARAMFVDARSHVGDPRRGSPCTVGSAGGQSITTVRQAPPVGAIDYRLHAPRPEEGQSSAATGYAGALAPKAPPRRQLAGAGLWGSCQPAERERPQTWPAAFAFLAPSCRDYTRTARTTAGQQRRDTARRRLRRHLRSTLAERPIITALTPRSSSGAHIRLPFAFYLSHFYTYAFAPRHTRNGTGAS